MSQEAFYVSNYFTRFISIMKASIQISYREKKSIVIYNQQLKISGRMTQRKCLLSLQRKRQPQLETTQRHAYFNKMFAKQRYRKLSVHHTRYSQYRVTQMEAENQLIDRLLEQYPREGNKCTQNITFPFSMKKLRRCLWRFADGIVSKANEDITKLTSIVQSFEYLLEVVEFGQLIELDKIPWMSDYACEKVSQSIIKLVNMCNQRIILAQWIDWPNRSQNSLEENLQKFVGEESARRISRIREQKQLQERILETKRQNSRLQRKIRRLEIQNNQYRRGRHSVNNHETPRGLIQQEYLKNQIQRQEKPLQSGKDANFEVYARHVVFQQEQLKNNQKDINELIIKIFLQQEYQSISEQKEDLQISRQVCQESEYLAKEVFPGYNFENHSGYIDSFIDQQQNITHEWSPEYSPGQRAKVCQGVSTIPIKSYQKTCQRIEEEVVVNVQSTPYQDPPFVSGALQNSNQAKEFQQDEEHVTPFGDSGDQIPAQQLSQKWPLTARGDRKRNQPLKAKKIKKRKEVFAIFNQDYIRKKQRPNIQIGLAILWRRFKSQESEYLSWSDQLRDKYLPRQRWRKLLGQKVGRCNIQRAMQGTIQVLSQDDDEQEWEDQNT